jgi:hypothetical protein
LEWIFGSNKLENGETGHPWKDTAVALWKYIPFWLAGIGQFMYVAFFQVMHLMKLHSISLVWGVTTEAMEYEDVARKQQQQQNEARRKNGSSTGRLSTMGATSSENQLLPSKSKTRLQRLGLVSFGGTLGSLWGR